MSRDKNNGKLRIHLSNHLVLTTNNESSWRWGLFKTYLSINCGNTIIRYDQILKLRNNIDYKLYPSDNCRYFNILEKHVSALDSIQIDIIPQ